MTTLSQHISTGISIVNETNFDNNTMIDISGDFISSEWVVLPSGATVRSDHSMTIIGTDIYVFGGNAPTPKNDLWKYNTITGSWIQLTLGSTARHSHSMVSVGTDIYVFGGKNFNGTAFLNDLWKYNTLTNTWTQLLSGASIRSNHSAVSIGTDMYIFGGWNGAPTPLGDLWKYDTLLNTWTQMSTGSTPRYAHAFTVIGTDMYIHGGISVAGNATPLNGMWKYSSTLNVWFNTYDFLNTSPSPRDFHSMSAVGTDIYLFGGFDNIAKQKDVWKFNSLDNTWVRLHDINVGREQFSVVTLNNDIFIFGGVISEGNAKTNDLLKYNTLRTLKKTIIKKAR